MKQWIFSTTGYPPVQCGIDCLTNAYYAALTSYLGLRSKDLAEIGGFSDRYARDLLTGDANFHVDIKEAILLIQSDIDVMIEAMDDMDVLPIFRANKQLREAFKAWPSRGHAAGGFVGPHRVAVVMAHQETGTEVVWVD